MSSYKASVMRKRILTIFICFFVLLFTACAKSEIDENSVTTTYFDTYIYLSNPVVLPDFGDIKPEAVVVQNDRIYYCYVEWESSELYSRTTLTVVSLTVDGHESWRTQVPFDQYVNIKGFRIKDNDTIAVFAMQWNTTDFGIAGNYFYAEYDIEGTELVKKYYTELLQDLAHAFDILQVVITESGNIAITAHDERGITLHIINSMNESVSELHLNADTHRSANSMVATKDDRVLVLDIHEDDTVLREVDLISKSWVSTHPVNCGISSAVFPAGSTDFDLIISDRDYLYGYSLQTNEQTTLLSWVETGLVNLQDAYIGMFSDGSISVLLQQQGNYDSQGIMLYILNPFPRVDLTGKITLTLGGVHIPNETLEAVVEFNLNNTAYRIVVEDYAQFAGGWEAGLTRLQIDLMTGGGPDLILNSFNILPEQGPYLDLYPFIDNDPVINRADFFSNFLLALENSDGILPMITNGVSIRTMIGTAETVGYIDKWTLSELLALVEGSSGLSHPIGTHMMSLLFISDIVRFSGMGFLDMHTYTADLDNAAFIEVLELSRKFPRTWEEVGTILRSHPDEYLRILRGEQALRAVTLFELEDYHLAAELFGNDLQVIGFPSINGGVHIIETMVEMGINASSEHPDGAWEFLRGFLLPATPSSMVYMGSNFGFPLRIDLFEALVADAPAPHYILDLSSGNLVEMPPTHFLTDMTAAGTPISYEVTLTPMSDVAANNLRSIVTSAQSGYARYSPELWDIIAGDLAAFYDDAKTAEETAQIMQNRLQRYLSEQQVIN